MTRKAVSLKSNTDAGEVGRLFGTHGICARTNFDRKILRAGLSTEVVDIYSRYEIEFRVAHAKFQLQRTILAYQRAVPSVPAMGPKMSEISENSKTCRFWSRISPQWRTFRRFKHSFWTGNQILISSCKVSAPEDNFSPPKSGTIGPGHGAENDGNFRKFENLSILIANFAAMDAVHTF